MGTFNWLQRLIKSIFSLFPSSKTMTVWVGGEKRTVKNPTTFDELNEEFGEGNWKL